MPRKFKSKKSSQTSVIIASLFLLLSLPLVIYGLFQKSFDIRNRAYDMLELSEKNPCIISFPNVNPYSLEVGKGIRIQVDAKFSNSGIKKLEMSDSTGKSIYTEEFTDSPLQMGTSFIFTPEKSGNIDILGMIEKTDGGSAGCKISSPYDVKGLRAIATNSSPEFTTNPSQSKPSQDIKTGIQYEYQLSALDTDGDRINYSYSFTPRADWLKPIVIEDGSNGKLVITFRGDSDKPASYLANVIIHDGYSKHVRSQSWVISVEQAENDIPKVKIIRPEDSLRIDAGRSFDSLWEVSDLNHVSSFELFMAKNVADEETWKKVSEKLPYDVLGSSVSTENLDSGTYKLVVKATDNQNPPKAGLGVSPEIVISRLSDNLPPSDDVVILGDAQVINMSPSAQDSVSNPRATIKGTLISSEGAEIKESSITFKVDDKDVTDKMKINKISENEYTLIYQPTEDLVNGTHKGEISFEDTKGKRVVKTWDFTINTSGDNSGSYNIFGVEINKRTLFIIGIGLLLIVIAICIPLLIAAIWGKGRKEKQETTYLTRNTPTSTEYSEDIYVPPTVNTGVRKMVEADITTPYIEPTSETTVVEKETIFTPPLEEIEEKKEGKSEIYSSVPNIDIEETNIRVEEPEKKDEIKVDIPKIEIKEEPKSAFDVKVETAKEETIPTPTIETTETTIKTDISDIKTDEPKIEIKEEPESAFDVKIETTKEEPVPTPTVETTETIIKTDISDIKIDEPKIEIKEEPKSTFDVKVETAKEETIPTPTIETTETTIKTDLPEVKVSEEPKSTFDVPIEITTTETINTEEIPEPEAPDPSAFLKIAQQIEQQTGEDISPDSTNP